MILMQPVFSLDIFNVLYLRCICEEGAICSIDFSDLWHCVAVTWTLFSRVTARYGCVCTRAHTHTHTHTHTHIYSDTLFSLLLYYYYYPMRVIAGTQKEKPSIMSGGLGEIKSHSPKHNRIESTLTF